MKKKIRSLFIKLFARRIFQPFFKKLHWLSLRGMNYGGGYGPYDSGEIFLLNYIKNQTFSKVIILDVGANIGSYALLANQIFNSDCTIYSFEPASVTYSYLKERVKNKSNIIPINKGIAEVEEKATIYFDETGSVQSSLVEDTNLKYSETIELTTVNDFCTKQSLEHITLLKLDVEGYEYNALLGCKDWLSNINYIQFEFGNKQVQSRHFLKDFVEILPEFKLYRIVQDGLIEIDKNPINEIFQTSNYVGIHHRVI